MSSIQITIDSAQVEALLSNIMGKVDHLQPVMAAICNDLHLKTPILAISAIFNSN
jgi:hypothetical protein